MDSNAIVIPLGGGSALTTAVIKRCWLRLHVAAESPEQSAACLLDCYSSPNASRPPDVLGTLMLGILAGSKRYAHIAGVRGDAVTAKALGLNGMVSEDSVRRELKAVGGSVPGLAFCLAAKLTRSRRR